jgi:hypothetical protein
VSGFEKSLSGPAANFFTNRLKKLILRDKPYPPNEAELKGTKVIAFAIEQASAKVRNGPPKDEPEDEDDAVWAGVVPLTGTWLPPLADEISKTDLAVPESVKKLFS